MTNTDGKQENLPSAPLMFINRAKEVATLKHALPDPNIQAFIIYGAGGMGKTALARFVVSQPNVDSQFPGGIVFVDCRTEDSLPKILKAIAHTLDIESVSLPPGALRDAVTSQLRSQATLIVLDSYEMVADNDEVLSFIGRLPKQTKLLITSRERVRIPNRNIYISLENLTESEIIEFLKQRLEPKQLSNVDRVDLQDIYRLTGGLPLALELFTGLLKQGSSPSEVLRKIEDEHQIIHFAGHGKFPKLDDVLKQTITTLPDQPRKFIEALSVFAHPAEGEAIAAVARIKDWHSSGKALTQNSLVVVEGTKYALHPLARTYLRSQLSPKSLAVLQRRMVKYFLAYVKKHQSNFEQLDREWRNIQYSVETAYSNELCQEFVELVLTLGKFLDARGYQDEYQKWLNQALEASKKLGDIGIRAALWHNLAIQYQQRSEWEAALNAYKKSLQYSEEISDVATESATLGNLGLTYQSLGQIDKAIEYYQQALAICRQLGDLNGESYQLRNLGLAYANLNDFEQAIAYYHQALEISREFGDRYTEANLFANLGIAYSNRIRGERAENLELAIAYYHQALEISREIGNRYAEANLLANLGNVYSDRITGERAENLELAIALYHQALKLSQEIDDRTVVANVLANLGNVYSNWIRGDRAENLELAIALYHQALEVYTPDAFPYEWATTQNNLGAAYSNRIRGERAENLERAIAAYQSALSVYTREAFPQSWANVQNNLGNVYLSRIRGDQTENLEKAIAAFQTALTVITREAFPQDWAAIQSNLGKAYIQRKLGDPMENLKTAIFSYQNALQVYTRESFPRDWLKVTTNLSTAYAEIGNWSEAKEVAITILQTFQAATADVESVEALTPWYQHFGELAIQNKDLEFATRIFAETAYRFELQGVKVPDVICNQLNELRELVGEEHFSITWAEVRGVLTPLIAQTLHDARNLMRKEQFGEAFDKLSTALEMLSETQAKNTEELNKQQATILFLRGFCLRKQGDWETALKDQEQSFKLFENIRDFFNTARVLLEMGHLYEVMNNYEPARIYYMDAYRHSRRAKDKRGMASASEQLGRLEYRVRMFPQAVKDLEEARKLYISVGESTKATAIASELEDAKASLVYQANKQTGG